MWEVVIAGALAFAGSALGAFLVDRRQRDRRWDQRRIEALTAAALGVKRAQGKTWAFVTGALDEAPPGRRPKQIDSSYNNAFYALRELGLLVPEVEADARRVGDMLDPLYKIAAKASGPDAYREESANLRSEMDATVENRIVPMVRQLIGIKSAVVQD